MATDITVGSVTFSLEGTLTNGTDAAGVPWVVIPTGSANITGITPVEADDGSGNTVNGAMLNPLRDPVSTQPDQGYDERESTYNALVAASYPLSVTAGDVVIKTVAEVPSVSRGGRFSEIVALHILPSAPTGEYLLGPSIGWSGKSTPDTYPIDLSSWYTGRTVYSSSGIDFPSYATITTYIDQFYPLFAQCDAANATAGYESFSPAKFGGNRSSSPNYGDYIAQIIGMAMAAITTDVYSETETKNLARRLIQHGIQWGDPLIYSSRGKGADGGHFQFHQGPTIFALSQTGRSGEIPDVMANAPGNWGQAFLINSDFRRNSLVPHSDTSKPCSFRRRTLGAQPGGSVVRIPVSGSISSGDWNQVWLSDGMTAVRESDGVSVTVTTDTLLGTSGTVDVPVSEESPFSSGDVIYFDCPDSWIAEGQYDWSLRGLDNPNLFTPVMNNEYRKLQSWFPSLLAIRALGIFDASLEPAMGYAIRAELSDDPSATNNYPSINENWKVTDITSYTANTDYYSAHGSSINALDYSTATATVETALHIDASATVMSDGLVIGLVPGETEAWVNFSGTATTGETVEIRIREQGDSSTVKGWTPLAVSSGGIWSGELLLPKGQDWWKADVRTAGNRDTEAYLTEKFAVGYKVVLLGQSQMAIMMTTEGSVYSMAGANEDTSSYYEWQAYGFSGTPAASESLTIINNLNGSDGLRAFIDQFRVFEPSAPLMLIREAVNGTSILDFLDDDDATRAFSDLTDKTNKYGPDISAVVESWTTSNASPLEGNEGIDLLQGINTHGFGVDNSLADVFQSGYVFVEGTGTRHNNTSTLTYDEELVLRANELSYAVGPPIKDYELGDGETAHPRGGGQGNSRLGARLALATGRAIGLDTSENPYISSAERSLDGKSIVVEIARPNGGILYSPAPEALSGWKISENSGSSFSDEGFTSSLLDGSVVFRKDSGTWASPTSLQVRKLSNLTEAVTVVTEEEQAVVAGELYETYGGDVLGLGIPVHGLSSAGEWVLPGRPTLTNVSQGTDNPGPTPPSDMTNPDLTTTQPQAALDIIKVDCDTLNGRGNGTAVITASDLTNPAKDNVSEIDVQYQNQVNIKSDNSLSTTLIVPSGDFVKQYDELYQNNVALEADLPPA